MGPETAHEGGSLDDLSIEVAIRRGLLSRADVGRAREAFRLRQEDGRGGTMADAIGDSKGLVASDVETIRREAMSAAISPPRPEPAAAPRPAPEPAPPPASARSRAIGFALGGVVAVGLLALGALLGNHVGGRPPAAATAERPQARPRAAAPGEPAPEPPAAPGDRPEPAPSVDPPEVDPGRPSRGDERPDAPVDPRPPERRPDAVAPPVVAPPDVEEDPRRLAEWLLARSDAEFERMYGTPDLDGYVTRVVGALTMEQAGAREPPREVAAFLERVNERVDRARRGR